MINIPPRTIKSIKKDEKKDDEKIKETQEEKEKRQTLEMESLLADLGIDGNNDVISSEGKKVTYTYDAMDENASAPVKPEGDIFMISSVDAISEIKKWLSLNDKFNRMVVDVNGAGMFSTICDDVQTYINHYARVILKTGKFMGKGQLLFDWEMFDTKIKRFSDTSMLTVTFRPNDMMWTIQTLKTVNSFETFGDYDKKFPIKQRLWDEENIEGKIRYTNKGNPLDNYIRIKVGKLKRIMDVCESFTQAMIPLKAKVGENNIGTLNISLQTKGDSFEDEILIEGYNFANGKSAEAYIKSEHAEIFNLFSSDDEVDIRWGTNTIMLVIFNSKTNDIEVETKTAIPLLIPRKK